MKQIHHFWLTVYSKENEDESIIIENMLKFFPFNLKENKIPLERKTTQGFNEEKIIVLKVHLKKQSHLNKFIKHLLSILNQQQKELLLKQKESRLDMDNHFFIRFDKNKLIQSNEFFITDDGNCFHLKLSIAAFPTTRQNALKVIEEIF